MREGPAPFAMVAERGVRLRGCRTRTRTLSLSPSLRQMRKASASMFCFATEVLEPFFPLLIHYLTGYWVCMNHGRNETLVQVGYPVKQLIRYVHEGIRYIRITRKPKKKKKKKRCRCRCRRGAVQLQGRCLEWCRRGGLQITHSSHRNRLWLNS